MTGKAAELSDANWIKSSFSSGGDNCVEVAVVVGATAVRDSKVPQGPVLTFATVAFGVFVDSVKIHGLDRAV
ncbi:DUF397 domain-containing protein [Streptomyces sp. 21So2-11]|uniref:DUF397 domain-containing protein n=1 Tax=Streptomyces sp. 21So2-11 TaxID=3144408 RepID=UPI0032194114